MTTADRRTVIARQSPYRSDATQRIDEKELDPFGHSDYADAIEAALAEVPSQFTLGLFGPWGSGKSTILEELSRRLNDQSGKTALAVFDAWRYDGDSLRREFIRAVAQKLKDHRALPKRFKVERHMEAFELDVTKPREAAPRPTLASFFSAALSALIVLAVIGALYGLVALFDPNDKTAVRGAIAVLGPLIAFILIVAGRLVSPVQVQEARRRFEFPEQFAQNFRELLDKVNVGRVVIAIDNLDRCSPKRVAEVLTTIKTFLEPALEGGENPGAKSLCFIIAADDEALRRHLVAQELAASVPASPKASSGSQDDQGSEELATEEDADEQHADPMQVAREAVDEYLRKFFNGSIRIAEMLDEDMREFSARELANFIAWHEEIDEATADKLIELTSHGLKGNPRRIKQFINDLELRLQLLSDRRAAEHIQIEADVLMVAKLAIFEEKFPEEHKALRRKPVLLERWHELAEEGMPDDLNPDMVAFLRFTNNIRSPDIVAYLTMKQTKAELHLPGYAEFIAMLDEARGQELEENLATMSAEEVERHATAAGTHFDGEIDARAWSTAFGTARSVIETAQLREAGSLLEHVLDRSLAHGELKARLIDLGPQLLLEVGLESLDATAGADLVGAVMAAAQGKDVAPQRRRQICEAVERNAERLDATAKGHVVRAFRDPILRNDFSAYADLADKLPEIVSREAVSEAVAALGDADGFEAVDPRLRVALASPALLSANSELADSLLQASRGALDVHRHEAGTGFLELADKLAAVVPLADKGDGPLQLAQDIEEKWGDTHSDAQWPSLEFGLTLCQASTDADSSHGDWLGRHVFDASNQQRTAGWAGENLDLMPEGFRTGFLARLVEGLAGAGDDVPHYLRIAAEVDGQERQALLTRAVQETVRTGSYGVAESLLGELSNKEALPLVEKVAERLMAEPQVTIDAGGMELLIEHQEALGSERVEELAESLVALLIDRRALAPGMGPLLGKLRVKTAERRLSLVRRLINFEAEVQNVNRREGILKGANGLAGKQSSNARKAIDERLDEMRRAGGAEEALAERVAAEG